MIQVNMLGAMIEIIPVLQDELNIRLIDDSNSRRTAGATYESNVFFYAYNQSDRIHLWKPHHGIDEGSVIEIPDNMAEDEIGAFLLDKMKKQLKEWIEEG